MASAGKSTSVLLLIVLGLGGHALAKQNPLAPQNPIQPGNPLAPGNPDVPGNPLAGANQQQGAFPAWMKAGVRVTYESGDSIIPDTPLALQPDGKGNWFDTQGRAFTPGRGGVGITALDIVDVTADTLAADLRNYAATLLDQSQYTFVSSTGVLGTANGLGDFWMPPDRLRAMPAGNNNGVMVTRETYPLNGRDIDAIGITTYDRQGFTRLVYDSESGLLIVLSSSRVSGNSNVIAHLRLLGIREMKLPWKDDALPDWMSPNHQIDYTGVYNNIANGMESPMRYSFSLALGERHGNAVRAKQVTVLEQGNGMPPANGQSDRVFGAGGLGPFFINPQTLAKLQPGQVLDEDAATKSRLSFAGVQNGLAYIAEQRGIETYQFGYDTQNGVLRVVFLEKQQGLGAVLRVQLQLSNLR